MKVHCVKSTAVFAHPIVAANWIFLHEGHDHGSESSTVVPLDTVAALVGVAVFVGVTWYAYVHYLQ